MEIQCKRVERFDKTAHFKLAFFSYFRGNIRGFEDWFVCGIDFVKNVAIDLFFNNKVISFQIN